MIKHQDPVTKPLRKSQLELLEFCFKFRFVNVSDLALWMGRDKSTVYESLMLLYKAGYIDRKYKKSYKLAGKPASYCLSKAGITYLIGHTDLHQETLKNMYKNPNISQSYIDHQLEVLRIHCSLVRDFGSKLGYYSRSEISQYDYFMRPLADIYLQPKRRNMTHYLLDDMCDVPLYLVRKRIRAYADNIDDGEFTERSDSSYPTIILVLARSVQEKSIQEYITRVLENSWMSDELRFLTITRSRLFRSDLTAKIWLESKDDQDKDLTLVGIR